MEEKITRDPIRLAGRAFIAVSLLALARAGAGAPAPASPAPLTAASNLMVEQEVTVTTRVSGVIDSIQAERGQLVRKG
ncbi:MAG TPA: hypothetical protein VHP60_03820, partial [Thermoanaerobaculia bacterium]|nr:hypothetical protein [Thermoanaerobaculia bacterium]